MYLIIPQKELSIMWFTLLENPLIVNKFSIKLKIGTKKRTDKLYLFVMSCLTDAATESSEKPRTEKR